MSDISVSLRALDGLGLTVRSSEVPGFLGPNGAGKSTTIRLLLGLRRADSGTVELFGGDPWPKTAELHHRLAYVPEEVDLWPGLTGGEVIDFLCQLRGGINESRRADLVRRLRLDTTKKGKAYSKGNRQKVALVAALSSDVELQHLGEPTSGLDPIMESEFERCIDEFRDQGGTVLLSNRNLAEVDQLCDRVSIVREGRLVEFDTMAELRHLHRTSIHAELSEPAVRLDTVPGIHNPVMRDHQVDFEVDATQVGEATIRLRVVIRAITSQPPSPKGFLLRQYAEAYVAESADWEGDPA